MRRTNSIGKIMLLTFLTSLFFATVGTYAFMLLEAWMLIACLGIISFICLVLMFTQDINRRPDYPVDCDQPMMRHWRRYR
jgi:hypothetical protein